MQFFDVAVMVPIITTKLEIINSRSNEVARSK